MEAAAREEAAQRAQAAASASSSNGGQGFSLEGKRIVRISPALLGSIGDAAAAVTEGSLVRRRRRPPRAHARPCLRVALCMPLLTALHVAPS